MRWTKIGLVVICAGCAAQHGIGDDAGSMLADDGSAIVDFDTAHDAGAPPAPDTGGILPRRDAGMHSAPDIGPAGDGLGDHWDGYIEMEVFPSGSSRVRIELDGSGAPTGVVLFGEGVAPPPATDANAGYPAGEWYRSGTGTTYIAQAHPYRFAGATVSGTRVQLSVDIGQLWATWCGLQLPVIVDQDPPNPDYYDCLPSHTSITSGETCAYTSPAGENIEIDCARLVLCSGAVCVCDAESCAVAPGASIDFDFHVSGSDGTGTVRMPDGLHNVYVTR